MINDLRDRFIRGLACAALSPGLRSILVFDASPEALQAAATTLGQMLATVSEREIKTIRLGSSETDDDLWGTLTLAGDKQVDKPAAYRNISAMLSPGLLTTGRQNGPLLLVVIPDLTRLTLAAARACVMLMGSDTAHLARHGQHDQWVPDICWLAGCNREHVGQISPHLLDRFALRLHGANASEIDRERGVLTWANASSSEIAKDVATGGIDEAVRQQLQAAAQRWATITPAAMASIQSYVPIVAVESARRSIALARLAQADARLKGDAQVTADHVEAAVRLIGLRLTTQPAREPSPNAEETLSDVGTAPELPDNATPKSRTASERPLNKASSSEETQKPVYQAPESPTPFEPIPLLSDPYPEDDAPVEREATPLRLALPSRRTTSVARGPAIGVQPATDLNDLSVVGTILAAAKYQPIRRQNSKDKKAFQAQKALRTDERAWLWRSSDLRRYRRLPVAEKMLLLVLDYTCLDDVDWQNALFPYLRWAYVERATIGIVQVGVAINQIAQNAPIHPDELRAKLIMARSILTPRIDAALMAQAGRATPLAHGLQLAYQTLRDALQHGRHTIEQAWLVVLTDGRGNVPLEASQNGQIQLPINREGIEDALQIAQHLHTLKHVQVTLLDPQPQQHAELPYALAEALGAAHVSIPSLEEELG